VDVVVGGRDVLVAEQVTDANEVAGALGELGRQAVPEVVGAELGGALANEKASANTKTPAPPVRRLRTIAKTHSETTPTPADSAKCARAANSVVASSAAAKRLGGPEDTGNTWISTRVRKLTASSARTQVE